MAGGMLNLITPAKGFPKTFIGNPQKTFFKVKYQRYTNFGIQKFRIDYEGTKTMNENTNSYFKFKISRFGDLLSDIFVVINLPDIWSSIYKYTVPGTQDKKYKEFKFKWIENIGTEIIKEITINIGTQEILKYSGSFLTCNSYRTLSAKKIEFNHMTGNIEEIYNPESKFNGKYPTAMFSNINGDTTIEPSIKGKKLYIPLHSWFKNAKLALPLIALQNVETTINITLRPINDLFTILDQNNIRRRVTAVDEEQLFNFINPPPQDISDGSTYVYSNKNNVWNFDLHLMCNYIFLDNEERKYFAHIPQKYLIHQVFESEHPNIGGSKRINLNSNGLVSNIMFYLQRNDIKLRNEWSNYSNWEYSKSPQNLVTLNSDNKYFRDSIEYTNPFPLTIDNSCCFTGQYNQKFTKNILQNLGIIIDGKYRENNLDAGIYNYIEGYNKTTGNFKDGLYYYYYALTLDQTQSSGFIDANFFKNIELETETISLIIDTSKNTSEPICATVTNENGVEVNAIVGYSKTNIDEDIFLYNYNLKVFEERLNILNITGGEGFLEVKN